MCMRGQSRIVEYWYLVEPLNLSSCLFRRSQYGYIWSAAAVAVAASYSHPATRSLILPFLLDGGALRNYPRVLAILPG